MLQAEILGVFLLKTNIARQKTGGFLRCFLGHKMVDFWIKIVEVCGAPAFEGKGLEMPLLYRKCGKNRVFGGFWGFLVKKGRFWSKKGYFW